MANPLTYAVPAAAAGLVVGGPIGAAVGGAAGLLLSFVGGEAPSDQSKKKPKPKPTSSESEDLNQLPNVDPAQLARDGLNAADILEMADQLNVDPSTIYRAKDGSYTGQYNEGANWGDYRPVACAVGRDCGAAEQAVGDRYVEQRRKNPDFDVEDYTRGISYENLRRRGQTHQQANSIIALSERSYEYCLYEDGKSEAECQWLPLDNDIDKAEAWDYVNSRIDVNTGDKPVWSEDRPRACTKYYHCADDEYCDGGICMPFVRRRVCPDDNFTVVFNKETCPGEAYAPLYQGERELGAQQRELYADQTDPRLAEMVGSLNTGLFASGDDESDDPLANLRTWLAR